MDNRTGYTEPRAGELDKRVVLRRRADLAAPDMGLDSQYINQITRWAKITPVGTAIYTGSVQTETKITHRVVVRYLGELTTDYEVVHGKTLYRVRRCTAMNGAKRFTLLEVEELGDQVYAGELYA